MLGGWRSRLDAVAVGRLERSCGLYRRARIASLIETWKLEGGDPRAYLADVLTKFVNLWPPRVSTINSRADTSSDPTSRRRRRGKRALTQVFSPITCIGARQQVDTRPTYASANNGAYATSILLSCWEIAFAPADEIEDRSSDRHRASLARTRSDQPACCNLSVSSG
jgi:hypothetical protein